MTLVRQSPSGPRITQLSGSVGLLRQVIYKSNGTRTTLNFRTGQTTTVVVPLIGIHTPDVQTVTQTVELQGAGGNGGGAATFAIGLNAGGSGGGQGGYQKLSYSMPGSATYDITTAATWNDNSFLYESLAGSNGIDALALIGGLTVLPGGAGGLLTIGVATFIEKIGDAGTSSTFFNGASDFVIPSKGGGLGGGSTLTTITTTPLVQDGSNAVVEGSGGSGGFINNAPNFSDFANGGLGLGGNIIVTEWTS